MGIRANDYMKTFQEVLDAFGFTVTQGDWADLSPQSPNTKIRVEHPNYIGELDFNDLDMIAKYMDWKNDKFFILQSDEEMMGRINVILTRRALFQVGEFCIKR